MGFYFAPIVRIRSDFRRPSRARLASPETLERRALLRAVPADFQFALSIQQEAIQDEMKADTNPPNTTRGLMTSSIHCTKRPERRTTPM